MPSGELIAIVDSGEVASPLFRTGIENVRTSPDIAEKLISELRVMILPVRGLYLCTVTPSVFVTRSISCMFESIISVLAPIILEVSIHAINP